MTRVFQIVVLTFALGLVPVSLSACGWPSSGEPPSQQVAVANENALHASEGNQVDKPAPAGGGNWGTVKGQIVWAGGPIPPLLLASTTGNKDETFCLSKGPIHKEEWVINPKSNGVRWTFVWLTPETGGPKKMPANPAVVAALPKRVVIDQPCLQFLPQAFAIMEGQELDAKNSASVPHIFNYTGGLKNPGDNKLIAPGGELVIKNLVAHYIPIKVSCTIHPWMNGWVRVFDHPYFAVTDEEGKFTIKNAPAGKYRLVGWHESVGWLEGGKMGVPVEVKANDEIEVKFDVKPAP